MPRYSLVGYTLLFLISSVAAADLPSGIPDLLRFAVAENERALQRVSSVSYRADSIYTNSVSGTTVTAQDVIDMRPSRFVSANRLIRDLTGEERVLICRAVTNDRYRAVWETDGRNARSFDLGEDVDSKNAKTSIVLSVGPDYLLEGPFGFSQKTLREIILESTNDQFRWDCHEPSEGGAIVARLVSNEENPSKPLKEITVDPKSGFLITRIVEYAGGSEVRRTEVKARVLGDGTSWFPTDVSMKEGASSELRVSFSNVTPRPNVDENTFSYAALQMPEKTLLLAWSPTGQPHAPQIWSEGQLVEFKLEQPTGGTKSTKVVPQPLASGMPDLLWLIPTVVGAVLLLLGCWSLLHRGKPDQLRK